MEEMERGGKLGLPLLANHFGGNYPVGQHLFRPDPGTRKVFWGNTLWMNSVNEHANGW